MVQSECLKVLETIQFGYRFTYGNLNLVFRAVVIPFLLSLCLYGLTHLIYPYIVGAKAPLILDPIVFMLVMALFAVAWHQAILIEGFQVRFFHFARREFLYFMLLLAFDFVWMALIFFGEPLTQPANGSLSVGVFIVAFILKYFVFCLFSFVSLSLVAIALQDGEFKVTQIWGLLKGNRWRFFAIVNLSVLPSYVIYSMLTALLFYTLRFQTEFVFLMSDNLGGGQNAFLLMMSLAYLEKFILAIFFFFQVFVIPITCLSQVYKVLILKGDPHKFKTN
jgi:hypothetical protein